MDRQKKVLGTFLGVALAVALLPGIAISESPFEALFVTSAIFVIVNQLISTYPSDIRNAEPFMVVALGLVGIVQDTLIWLLAKWLGGELDTGLHVGGIVAPVLGGVIVRATVLASLALPVRQREREAG